MIGYTTVPDLVDTRSNQPSSSAILSVSEKPGTVRIQAPKNSTLCQWFAVLEAAAFYRLDCSKAIEALKLDQRKEPSKRELDGLLMKNIAREINVYIPNIEVRRSSIMKADRLIELCQAGEHSPRVVMIGWFHAICIIEGRIHCCCEKYPIPLTLENLRRCSDSNDASLSDLRVTVHREVVLSTKPFRPDLSRRERKRVRAELLSETR